MAETEITIHYQTQEQAVAFNPNSHVAEVLHDEEKPAQSQDVEKTLLVRQVASQRLSVCPVHVIGMC